MHGTAETGTLAAMTALSLESSLAPLPAATAHFPLQSDGQQGTQFHWDSCARNVPGSTGKTGRLELFDLLDAPQLGRRGSHLGGLPHALRPGLAAQQ